MYSQDDGESRIRTFKDLYAWQEAHKLVLLAYRVTDKYPVQEKLALTNQIRRAAVSVTSNIAEGFSRKNNRDKSHFYSMALGSLTELQSQVADSLGIGYVNKSTANTLNNQSEIVHKLINDLIKSTKNLKPHP